MLRRGTEGEVDEQGEQFPKFYVENRERHYLRSKLGKCFLITLLIVFVSILSMFVFANFYPLPTQIPAVSEQSSLKQDAQPLRIQSTQPSEIDLQNLQPFYIWLGEMREKDIEMLNSLPYSFRLIRDCDKLMQKMQEQILQKFNPEIYNKVNVKSDVCRMIVLYYEGGLYLDLDTIIDLSCLKKYLKGKRIFFEATSSGNVDIFAIYSSRPYDPEILKAIRSENTYNSQRKSNPAMTLRIDKNAKTIGNSGCIKHEQERSWVSFGQLEAITHS